MDGDIDSLVRRMGRGNVLRMSSAESTDILRAITVNRSHQDSHTSFNTGNAAAHVFTGHHSPTAVFHNELLSPILLRDLKREHRHSGKIICLRIVHSRTETGNIYTVEDRTGAQCILWSLIARPLGGDGLPQDTHVTIAEPYFGVGPRGQPSICLHHPTDCRFDPRSADTLSMFSPSGDDIDLIKAGDTAFAAGRLLEAIEMYSREVGKRVCSAENMGEVAMKRAFCYSRLGVHTAVLRDAKAVLEETREKVRALKLAYNAVLQLDRPREGLEYAQHLSRIDGGAASRALLARAQNRIRQTEGYYDFGALVGANAGATHCKDTSSFTGDIEVRSSNLGGRGMFAVKDIMEGALLLCEKAAAMSSIEEASSFGPGIENILLEEKTNGRVLSLLQQLAGKALLDPQMLKKVLQLHGGEKYPPDLAIDGEAEQDSSSTFDSYRILSILKYNLHSVLPGSTSVHHDAGDLANKVRPDASLAVSKDHVLGLWMHGSMFNHSCLPNCTWSWIGDMFVVRANRNLRADEELTLPYLPNSYDVEKRNKILASHNGFECACPLCKADGSISEESKKSRLMMQAELRNRLTRYGRGHRSILQVLPSLEKLVMESTASYEYPLYDGLPHIQLADVFVQMANVYLGEIENWTSATAAAKKQGRECFLAALEIGLKIKVISVEEEGGGYCELLLVEHSQPKAVGVLALMGLAELAFHESQHKRCGALKACAKQVYEIFYGESDTFEDRHISYECRTLQSSADASSKPVDWERRVKKAKEDKCAMPTFSGLAMRRDGR